MDEKRTIYYRGRDIETLDRDELLKACRAIMRMLEQERECSRVNAEMDQLFRETERVLRRREGFAIRERFSIPVDYE